ncbi:hypothetical protein [Streptomyces sp. NPDC090021]|uniref:hypothetical protein n=1 Tax=Streptomyces sp. NPDC090021 TaxID=3365919 RepID=UPI0038087434
MPDVHLREQEMSLRDIAARLRKETGQRPSAATVLLRGSRWCRFRNSISHALTGRHRPVGANPGELHRMRDPYRAHAARLREV